MAAQLMEAQKEQQQHERQCGLKQHQVRTVFVLCCCFSLLLLPFCWRLLWSPFGLSYLVTLDIAPGPRLNNPKANSEVGTEPMFNNSEVKSTELGTEISVDNLDAPSKLGTSVEGDSSHPAVVAAPHNETVTWRASLPEGEEYMWYSPHSGFSNQARELITALKIAFLLNRTLVLPPVLDHFEAAKGTCFGPILSQRDLRKKAWGAITSRFNASSPREYVSIADIVDLSSIKSIVKTIDLRVFLAVWCGVEIFPTCSGHLCHTLARDLGPKPWGSISSCAEQFFSTSEGHNRPNLITEVDDDCQTTVWTNGESPSEKEKLEALLIKRLQNDTALLSNINSSSTYVERKDVIQTLGPASPAGGSFLLSFGSLYPKRYKGSSGSYAGESSWASDTQQQEYLAIDDDSALRLADIRMVVDIKAPSSMKSTASILREIERQRFSVDIFDAGQYFVQEKIKKPFLCVHVRLEDGFFVHHQDKNIFAPLRQRLEQLEMKRNQTKSRQLNVFVMTDLPRERWQGTYLHDLSVNPKYKIHTMDGEEDLLMDLAEKIHFHEYGFNHGFLPQQFLSPRHRNIGFTQEGISPARLNAKAFDARLFVEEVVCSCATLGFQGTRSSTVSSNIYSMRRARQCPI